MLGFTPTNQPTNHPASQPNDQESGSPAEPLLLTSVLRPPVWQGSCSSSLFAKWRADSQKGFSLAVAKKLKP